MEGMRVCGGRVCGRNERVWRERVWRERVWEGESVEGESVEGMRECGGRECGGRLGHHPPSVRTTPIEILLRCTNRSLNEWRLRRLLLSAGGTLMDEWE